MHNYFEIFDKGNKSSYYQQICPDGYKVLRDKYLAKGFSMEDADIKLQEHSLDDFLLAELRLIYPDLPEFILKERIQSPLQDGFARADIEKKLNYIKNPPSEYYREKERAWYNRAKNRIRNKLDKKRDELYTIINKEITSNNMLRGCSTLLFLRKSQEINIKELLQEKGVRCFYHFTAKSNLESIIRYNGLYSRDCLEMNRIPVSFYGGNDVSVMCDSINDVKKYVHLSYNANSPMKRRVRKETTEDIIVLKISPEVALFSPTKFTDTNAASNTVKIDGSYEFLKSIDIDAAMQKSVCKGDNRYRSNQAEVLVRTWIPLRYILNIMEFAEFLKTS